MTQALPPMQRKIIHSTNSVAISDVDHDKKEGKRSKYPLPFGHSDAEQLIVQDHSSEIGSSNGSVNSNTLRISNMSNSEEKSKMNDDELKSRISQIQCGLGKNVSNDSKEKILHILGQVLDLSDVEKLLLYLQLPTGHASSADVTSKGNTKVEYSRAVSWINSHYEEDPGTSLLKSQMYEDYKVYCERENVKSLKFGDFNRVTREVYPSSKPRRLGVRGQSKYCLSGIKTRCQLPNVTLPTVEQDARVDGIKQCHEPTEEAEKVVQGAMEDEISNAVALSLICEWARKLFSQTFTSLQQLAQYLVRNGYVNSVSLEAFTIQAVSSNPSAHMDEPPAKEASTYGATNKVVKETEPDGRVDQRRATQLKLQRKLQERALLSQQKRLMEEQRSQSSTIIKTTDHDSSKEESPNTTKLSKPSANTEKDIEVKTVKKATNVTPQKLILPKSTSSLGQVQCVNNFASGLLALPTSQGLKASNSQSVFVFSNPPRNPPAPPVMILSPVSARGVVPVSAHGPMIRVQQPPIQAKLPLSQSTKTTSKPSIKSQKLQVSIAAAAAAAAVSLSSPTTPVTASPLIPLANLAPKLNLASSLRTAQHVNMAPKSTAVHYSTQQLQSTTPQSAQFTDALTVSKDGDKIVPSVKAPTLPVQKTTASAKSLHSLLSGTNAPSCNSDLSTQVNKTDPYEPSTQGVVSSKELSSSSLQSMIEVTESLKEETIDPNTTVTTSLAQGQVDHLNRQTSSATLPSTPASESSSVGSVVANYEKMLNMRSSPASTKPKLMAKTVSDLLKEQRGIESAEKRCFVNDSRPVAQILKETRLRQQHRQNVQTTSPQFIGPSVLTSPTGINPPSLIPMPIPTTALTASSLLHEATSSKLLSKTTHLNVKITDSIPTLFTNSVPSRSSDGGLNVNPNESLSSSNPKNSPKLRDLLNAKDDMPAIGVKRNVPKPKNASLSSLSHTMSRFPSLHKDLKAGILDRSVQEVKVTDSLSVDQSAVDQMAYVEQASEGSVMGVTGDMTDVEINYEVEKLLLLQQDREQQVRSAMKRAASEPPYRHTNKRPLLDNALGCENTLENDVMSGDRSVEMNQSEVVELGQRDAPTLLHYSLTTPDQSVLPDLGDITPAIDMMVGDNYSEDSGTVQKTDVPTVLALTEAHRKVNAKIQPNKTIQQLLQDRSNISPMGLPSTNSIYTARSVPTQNFGGPSQCHSSIASVTPSQSNIIPYEFSTMLNASTNRNPPEDMLASHIAHSACNTDVSSFVPIQTSVSDFTSVSFSFPVKPIVTASSSLDSFSSQSASTHLPQTMHLDGELEQGFVPYGSLQNSSLPSGIMTNTRPGETDILNSILTNESFAPASSIRPVKRGKGAGVTKEGKRMRHHSAQDSFLLKASLRASAKPTVSPHSQNQPDNLISANPQTGLSQDSVYTAISVSTQSQVPEQGNINPVPSPFSPEIHEILLSGDQYGVGNYASGFRSHSVPAHYMVNRTTAGHLMEQYESLAPGNQENLVTMMPSTASELKCLLQDKLLASSIENTRGVHMVSDCEQQLQARKNLSHVLVDERKLTAGLIGTSRGDHLISGAPFRPPLKYALSLPRGGDQLGNQDTLEQLQRVCHNSSYVVPSAVPTPPSSENTSPDFTDEVQAKMDGETVNYIMTRGMKPGTQVTSSSAELDTPSSLGVVSEADALTDQLLTGVCDEPTGDPADLMQAEAIDSFTWE